MTTIAPAQYGRLADAADVLAARRAFPIRRVIVNGRVTPVTTDYLREIATFWLEAAAGYAALAEQGCRESADDARNALEQAYHYAPFLAR